mgnify:CR=1 FL=1
MLFNFLIILSSVCIAHRYAPRRRVGLGSFHWFCCVLSTAPKTVFVETYNPPQWNPFLTRRPFVSLPSSVFLSTCSLLRSGDIHPNPGPDASTDTLDTSSLSSSYSDLINSGLSVVHLNTQSLRTKLDPIEIELQHYDVLIFFQKPDFLPTYLTIILNSITGILLDTVLIKHLTKLPMTSLLLVISI